jgi:hypothetical protein
MMAEALVGKVAEQRRVAAELFGASSGWGEDGPPLKWLRVFHNMSFVSNVSSAERIFPCHQRQMVRGCLTSRARTWTMFGLVRSAKLCKQAQKGNNRWMSPALAHARSFVCGVETSLGLSHFPRICIRILPFTHALAQRKLGFELRWELGKR